MSKILISFDVWTLSSRYAALGVFANLVRSVHVEEMVVYRNQAVLIGLKRIRDMHGSAEMSKGSLILHWLAIGASRVHPNSLQ